MLVLENEVPDGASGVRVDAGGRLVQYDGARPGDEGYGHGQLALHAARQTIHRTATLAQQTQVANHSRHTHAHTHTRSTQPCIPPASLNRVPASAGVRVGMSPLPGGTVRSHVASEFP